MTQDETSKKQDSESSKSLEHTRGIVAESPAPQPVIVPPQPAIEPTALPKNFGSDPRAEENKTKQKCETPISVNVLKDDALSGFERNSLRVNWITLGFVVLTFVVFFLQLRESQSQTRIFREQAKQAKADAAGQLATADQALIDSKEAFQKDQRPYIWFHDPPPDRVNQILGFDEQGQVIWNLWYSNYGKTPAIRMCSEAYIARGENALKKVYEIKHDTCVNTKRGEGIVAPGELQFLTAFTPDKPSRADFDKWTSADYHIAVFGRIDYADSLGGKYYTQFCYSLQSNKVFCGCGAGHDRIQ